MAKYDSLVTELKNLLPNAKNILIVLPAGSDMDKFAAGLSLFLSLKTQGKEVEIVSDDTVLVAHSHLFGVDHIQKNISQAGGNFTISLGGVVASDGTVPALQNLDWYPQGQDLNLVFHVLPGQTFQPTSVTPHSTGSGFNLIFTIGAANLNLLGSVYTQNQQIFSGIHIVNIDNEQANTSFGGTNVVDPVASSISEILVDVIPSLGLSFDGDVASNLIAGIFETTDNLKNQKALADTYLAVANCLRVGGRKPNVSVVEPVPAPVPIQAQAQSQPAGFDLSALIPQQPPIAPNFAGVSEAQAVSQTYIPPIPVIQPVSNPIPSSEERPLQEGVASADTIEVEPGWLTPKVFKGTG